LKLSTKKPHTRRIAAPVISVDQIHRGLVI
jgi:hypothetical protein